MKTLNKIMGTLALLTLSSSQSYAEVVNLKDYDFSVERSIWGAGPTKAIEPEIKRQQNTAKNDSVITPFEKFDLSDLTADQERRRKELMKKLMSERKVKAPIPLYSDESHSHIGVSLSGGMSNLKTKTSFGETNGSFTPGFMLDYYYFFNQRWGARLGFGMSYSRCEFNTKGTYRDSSSYIDFEGDTVGLSYNINKLNEKFSTFMLEVPVMASYNYNDWFFSAGLKFGFPLSIKYDQKMKDVDITAYYNFTDPIYNSKALGAMKDAELSKKGKFTETPVYIMAGANIGRKFRLNDMFDLGTSVYFDYSLNSLEMRSKNDKANYKGDTNAYYLIRNEELTDESVLMRDEPGAKTNTSSTLCSKRAVDGKRVITDLNYINFGVKVSLFYSSYANGTKEAKAEVERKAAMMQ